MFRSNWTARLEIYLVRIIPKNDAIFRKCLDTGPPFSVQRELRQSPDRVTPT